jgi:hypothetical protein
MNTKTKYQVSRKETYTPEFQNRWTTRRRKAKRDEVNRKKNRKCGYRG